LPQSLPQGHPEKNAIAPQKADEKFSLEMGEMERGVTLILSAKCKKNRAATGFLQITAIFFLLTPHIV